MFFVQPAQQNSGPLLLETKIIINFIMKKNIFNFFLSSKEYINTCEMHSYIHKPTRNTFFPEREAGKDQNHSRAMIYN